MTRLTFFFLVAFFPGLIIGQIKILNGQVKSLDDHPFIGATICQVGSKNCSFTDIEGLFHLKWDDNAESIVRISFPGYQTKTIGVGEGLNFLQATLSIDTLWTPRHPKKNLPAKKDSKAYPLSMQLGFDFSNTNFDDYLPQLGAPSVDFLNKTKILINFGLAYQGKKLKGGLNFGYTPAADLNKDDSLKLTLDNYYLDLYLGMPIVDSRRFRLTPKVGLKYYEYHFISAPDVAEVSLDRYLDEREIELKFAQALGYTGIDLEYKFYHHSTYNTVMWTVGLYGNYLFRLHDGPAISTKRNKITHDADIRYNRLNFGLNVGVNFMINTPTPVNIPPGPHIKRNKRS
jgi:hypothetical protein